MPTLSGVSSRTVSFSSTTIIRGCNKIVIRNKKEQVANATSQIYCFQSQPMNMEKGYFKTITFSIVYLIRFASCKSKSTRSSTSIYRKDDAINITCQYATMLGLRVLDQVLWCLTKASKHTRQECVSQLLHIEREITIKTTTSKSSNMVLVCSIERGNTTGIDIYHLAMPSSRKKKEATLHFPKHINLILSFLLVWSFRILSPNSPIDNKFQVMYNCTNLLSSWFWA